MSPRVSSFSNRALRWQAARTRCRHGNAAASDMVHGSASGNRHRPDHSVLSCHAAGGGGGTAARGAGRRGALRRGGTTRTRTACTPCGPARPPPNAMVRSWYQAFMAACACRHGQRGSMQHERECECNTCSVGDYCELRARSAGRLGMRPRVQAMRLALRTRCWVLCQYAVGCCVLQRCCPSTAAAALQVVQTKYLIACPAQSAACFVANASAHHVPTHLRSRGAAGCGPAAGATDARRLFDTLLLTPTPTLTLTPTLSGP